MYPGAVRYPSLLRKSTRSWTAMTVQTASRVPTTENTIALDLRHLLIRELTRSTRRAGRQSASADVKQATLPTAERTTKAYCVASPSEMWVSNSSRQTSASRFPRRGSDAATFPSSTHDTQRGQRESNSSSRPSVAGPSDGRFTHRCAGTSDAEAVDRHSRYPSGVEHFVTTISSRYAAFGLMAASGARLRPPVRLPASISACARPWVDRHDHLDRIAPARARDQPSAIVGRGRSRG